MLLLSSRFSIRAAALLVLMFVAGHTQITCAADLITDDSKTYLNTKTIKFVHNQDEFTQDHIASIINGARELCVSEIIVRLHEYDKSALIKLLDLLSKNRNLKSFSMGGIEITKEIAKKIAAGIKNNPDIAVLDLRYNAITYDGAVELLRGAVHDGAALSGFGFPVRTGFGEVVDREIKALLDLLKKRNEMIAKFIIKSANARVYINARTVIGGDIKKLSGEIQQEIIEIRGIHQTVEYYLNSIIDPVNVDENGDTQESFGSTIMSFIGLGRGYEEDEIIKPGSSDPSNEFRDDSLVEAESKEMKSEKEEQVAKENRPPIPFTPMEFLSTPLPPERMGDLEIPTVELSQLVREVKAEERSHGSEDVGDNGDEGELDESFIMRASSAASSGVARLSESFMSMLRRSGDAGENGAGENGGNSVNRVIGATASISQSSGYPF